MCAHRLTTANTDINQGYLQRHGLQPADVMVARSILHSLAPTWTLDEHHDPNGIFMLMLTPPGPEDTTPTFVLTQHPDGVQVAAALGDGCDTLHTAPSIRRAVRMALSLHNQTSGMIRQTSQAATQR